MAKRRSARGGGGAPKQSGKQAGSRVPHPVAENEEPAVPPPPAAAAAAEEAKKKATKSEEAAEQQEDTAAEGAEALTSSPAAAKAEEGTGQPAGKATEEEVPEPPSKKAKVDAAPKGGAGPKPAAEAETETAEAKPTADEKEAAAEAEKDAGAEVSAAATAAAADDVEMADVPAAKKDEDKADTAAKPPADQASTEEAASPTTVAKQPTSTAASTAASTAVAAKLPPNLILTATTTKRSLYECDYCKSDVTHIPRIRCASCDDFDLCLDCFAKKAGSGGGYGGGSGNSASSGGGGGGEGAGKDHTFEHGYRVSDSTRFPLFPTARGVRVDTKKGSNAGKEEGSNQEDDTEEKKPAAAQEDKDGDAVMADGVSAPTTETAANTAAATGTDESFETVLTVTDDPRSVWTAEEDLRLLDAISTYGLGNWADISEAVSGIGGVDGGDVGGGGSSSTHGGSSGGRSSGKSARRCMERYLDDFLGRYGHILPPYTLVEEEETEEEKGQKGEQSSSEVAASDVAAAAAAAAARTAPNDAAAPTKDAAKTAGGKKRKRDRRSPAPSLSRQASTVSLPGGVVLPSDKKYRAVPTSSIPGYDAVWPYPYLPPIANAKMGDEVGRDLSYKAEQEFVKLSTSASDKTSADRLREEWLEKRFQKPGGPTVLPMRLEDVRTMPGSELAGFMPRRGDFDIEWDNEAESILAEMEFSAEDTPQDRQLKLQILEIYNAKLDERERRKNFLIERKLLNYRKNQADDLLLPPDERDLVNRMRLFARFHSAEEHEKFIQDLLKAKRLRKEIARLQQYRRMGIQTLTEAERYELDRDRREHHRVAYQQKEAEDAKTAKSTDHAEGPSLWKEYGSDRRKKNGSASGSGKPAAAMSRGDENDGTKAMDVDENDGKKKTAASGEAADAFRIDDKPGFELLSTKEKALVERLRLLPEEYITAKKTLIAESFKNGMLSLASSKPIISMIDIEKRDGVVDFVLKSGWLRSS